MTPEEVKALPLELRNKIWNALYRAKDIPAVPGTNLYRIGDSPYCLQIAKPGDDIWIWMGKDNRVGYTLELSEVSEDEKDKSKSAYPNL